MVGSWATFFLFECVTGEKKKKKKDNKITRVFKDSFALSGKRLLAGFFVAYLV